MLNSLYLSDREAPNVTSLTGKFQMYLSDMEAPNVIFWSRLCTVSYAGLSFIKPYIYLLWLQFQDVYAYTSWNCNHIRYVARLFLVIEAAKFYRDVEHKSNCGSLLSGPTHGEYQHHK